MWARFVHYLPASAAASLTVIAISRGVGLWLALLLGGGVGLLLLIVLGTIRRARTLMADARTMYSDGPIVWLRSITGVTNVELGIEPPCSGSPHCSGAVHLRGPSIGGGERWVQLHLTREEIDRVRTLLLHAQVAYDRERVAARRKVRV